MNKGLIELLDHLMKSYIDEENYDYNAYIELAKALKALELIKKKCSVMPIRIVSKEEDDLLKEVLNDDN